MENQIVLSFLPTKVADVLTLWERYNILIHYAVKRSYIYYAFPKKKHKEKIYIFLI